MSSEIVYERYGTTPPPPPHLGPKKKIYYSQGELDDILEEHSTFATRYTFIRHDAEIIAAASVGRAKLPWPQEFYRTEMEVSNYATSSPMRADLE